MFLSCPRAVAAFLCFLVCFFASPAFSELLTLDMLLSEAQKNSFDVNIAREDVQASQAFVEEVKGDNYPQVSLRFGSEYVHAFEEDSDVVSVGDAIIANDTSGYKHSLIAGLSYNLFDFGVRRLSVENARRQVQIAGLLEKQSFWDLRKEILDRYSAALKLHKQILAFESILERQSQIFRLSLWLREAGTVGREQIGTAALTLAETLNQLDDLRVDYQNALGGLSFYTQQTYLAENIQLADLARLAEVSTRIDLDLSPEVRIFQHQIANKQSELSMVKRSALPKLTLYGSYRMFGSDADSFAYSMTDLSSRDASVTVYLEWPLFDGFANRAKKARLRHEIASLRYQKQKKKAELQQEYSSIVVGYEIYSSVQEDRRQQLEQIVREQDDAEQLAEQQITDQISFHQKMIQLTRQRLEVDLWQVEYAASTLALDFTQRAVQ